MYSLALSLIIPVMAQTNTAERVHVGRRLQLATSSTHHLRLGAAANVSTGSGGLSRHRRRRRQSGTISLLLAEREMMLTQQPNAIKRRRARGSQVLREQA